MCRNTGDPALNQKVSVIVMSLWRCKEGCISEDRGQRIEFEFGRETTSSDPTKASWSQMLLATIDATVLISGLSLLILVAGPVLLVLGADEESSAASVMPSLAADPGSRGETRGGGGGGGGGGGWGGRGGGEEQGRTGRAASDSASSLHHRRGGEPGPVGGEEERGKAEATEVSVCPKTRPCRSLQVPSHLAFFL